MIREEYPVYKTSRRSTKMFFAVVMTTVILALPFILLPPVIDRLFSHVHFRAIVRRLFLIDPEATIASVTESSTPKEP